MTQSRNSNVSIHIHPFMKQLGLKNSTLYLYALLYSFTNGRIGVYYGSQKRLTDYLGVSIRTIERGLKILREAALIENAVTEDGKCGIRCVPVKEMNEEKKENDSEERTMDDLYVSLMLKRHGEVEEGQRNMLRMHYKYDPPGGRDRTFLEFGRHGFVMMTEPQYRELMKLLPTCDLMPYFEKVERMIEKSLAHPGAGSCPRNHYKTIKKWIEEDLAL